MPEDIHDLIERSSLGTPEAKAARESVSDVTAARVVGVADGMSRERARILAILDDPDTVTALARANWNAAVGGPPWVNLSRLTQQRRKRRMRAALAVLRERIEAS